MALSSELISQFVKATREDTPKSNETIVYGTVNGVNIDGKTWVKLDGSDRLTPVATTAVVKAEERVTVLIKDHTATVVGNVTNPSASSSKVNELDGQISSFGVILADRVTTDELNATIATINTLIAKVGKFDNVEAITAEIESLKATILDAEKLTADDITAINAKIDSIQGSFADIENITTEDLEALNAEIHVLKGYTADFTYISADVLNAVRANINTLNANYATIDFANISEAAIRKLFSDSGIIKDLVVSEGKITGELVGVTIKGDLIEGNTIKADKLVVKGSDGLYYKLNAEGGATTSEQVSEEDLQNGLSGSIIVAKSITAEKVAVDDLVAFNATIGGFHITDNSLYSGVKSSAGNSTQGIYMDRDGQLSVGDADRYIKYYVDPVTGERKLALSADSIYMTSSSRTVDEAIEDAKASVANIHVGARNLIRNSNNLIFENYDFGDESYAAVLGAGLLGYMIL